MRDERVVSNLKLQSSEISEVRWFGLEDVWDEIQHSRVRFCVPTAGLNVLREYLKRERPKDEREARICTGG